ncbi:hypothetical protein Isop_2858 [Isosphaera pallida ATCC 43644]|uniref:Uncharacterized protein n=1 Tax=Isosphaera pallida (strain ATCC 43644 / DSM 9630 / IS1B) TaxID=575540 RepID=E8R1K5_ISOPI|nr:hypothetical protein [Isosphaera pallida]ADV63423.1 hypothetical protein Isop_2858 [Isosphaera pallida ATCC 43644]
MVISAVEQQPILSADLLTGLVGGSSQVYHMTNLPVRSQVQPQTT